MRWEDERYVRVYTRDTVDWLALSWDAQALLMQLLRKVDRAGLLPLTRHGKKGVAVAVGHPSQWARIEPAIEELLADGCIEIRANVLLFRNFIAAQETPQSDKQRKAESRARAADLAAAGEVTNRDGGSQNVTSGHESGQNVTSGHAASRGVTSGHSVPSRAVPDHAVPLQDLPPPAVASAGNGQGELLPGVQPTPPVKPAKKAKEAKTSANPTDPRHAPLVASLTAEGWPFDGGKDAANVKGLLALADQQDATRGELASPEILRRAGIAWAQFPSYHSARTLTALRMKWGEFATPEYDDVGRVPDGLLPTVPDACAGCGSSGEGASVGEPEVFLGYGCGCMSAWGTVQNQGLHFTKAAEWAAARKKAA